MNFKERLANMVKNYNTTIEAHISGIRTTIDTIATNRNSTTFELQGKVSKLTLDLSAANGTITNLQKEKTNVSNELAKTKKELDATNESLKNTTNELEQAEQTCVEIFNEFAKGTDDKLVALQAEMDKKLNSSASSNSSTETSGATKPALISVTSGLSAPTFPLSAENLALIVVAKDKKNEARDEAIAPAEQELISNIVGNEAFGTTANTVYKAWDNTGSTGLAGFGVRAPTDPITYFAACAKDNAKDCTFVSDAAKKLAGSAIATDFAYVSSNYGETATNQELAQVFAYTVAKWNSAAADNGILSLCQKDDTCKKSLDALVDATKCIGFTLNANTYKALDVCGGAGFKISEILETDSLGADYPLLFGEVALPVLGE